MPKGDSKTEIKITLTLTYLDPAPRKYAETGAKELGRQMHTALMGVIPDEQFERIKVDVVAEDLVPHKVSTEMAMVAGEEREVLRCATCNTVCKDQQFLTRRQWRERRAAFIKDHPTNEPLLEPLGERP